MSNSFGIIYKSTNLITGKSYIGQTTRTLEKRKWFHNYETINNIYYSYFHNSIKKYGFENFLWEVIDDGISRDELNKKEIYYINEHNTFIPKGYNLTLGGGGTSGHVYSEDQRKRISNSLKGKTPTEETRKKLSETHKIYSDDLRNMAIKLRKGGMLYKDISEELHICQGTIQFWCDDLKSRKCAVYKNINKENIVCEIRQHRKNNLSYDEIAKIMNIPKGTLYEWNRRVP